MSNERDEYGDTPDYRGGDFPNCPKCGSTMRYSYVKSEFKCPDCGHIMDEDEDDYEFNYDDPGNPPYGCEACGGPWPHCKASCNVINE